jgi:hypothetical protein
MTAGRAAIASFLDRPSAKGMSQEQKAYCLALAAHQLANEAARAEMASIPEPDPNNAAAVDAYCERYAEADDRAGVHATSDLLHEAESLLMAWGREVISKHGDAAKIPPDFWQKAAAHFKFRAQLVELCMKLDAAQWQRVTGAQP